MISSTPDVLIVGHVLRTLEHHVLEQVREAGAARDLVQRTDVVPDVDGDDRQPVIDMEDDLHSIWQRVLLVGDVELRRGAIGFGGQAHRADQQQQRENGSSHT